MCGTLNRNLNEGEAKSVAAREKHRSAVRDHVSTRRERKRQGGRGATQRENRAQAKLRGTLRRGRSCRSTLRKEKEQLQNRMKRLGRGPVGKGRTGRQLEEQQEQERSKRSAQKGENARECRLKEKIDKRIKGNCQPHPRGKSPEARKAEARAKRGGG